MEYTQNKKYFPIQKWSQKSIYKTDSLEVRRKKKG